MAGARNMAELIAAMKDQPKQVTEKVELTPEQKFEKLVFDYANTMRHRGGCYTTEYLNSVREIIKEKINKGEIKI